MRAAMNKFERRLEEITREAIEETQKVIAEAFDAGYAPSETAWLIEADGPIYCTGPRPPGWTTDHGEAFRFCGKGEAERYLRLYCQAAPNARVAEHMWIAFDWEARARDAEVRSRDLAGALKKIVRLLSDAGSHELTRISDARDAAIAALAEPAMGVAPLAEATEIDGSDPQNPDLK